MYEKPMVTEWFWKENECYECVLDFITSGKYLDVVEHIDNSKGAAFVVGMTYALGLMSTKCGKYGAMVNESTEDSDDQS